MISQLHIDKPELISERYRRVITTDPTQYYQRIYDRMSRYSHFKRTNTVCSETIFPQPDKTICACGCQQKLSGRRRRWATEECARFARQVMGIMSGDSQLIRIIIGELYHYDTCFICGSTGSQIFKRHMNNEKGYEKESILTMHLDHIIPVHKGGGCTWLSNYQILCVPCHKKKTKQDLQKQ